MAAVTLEHVTKRYGNSLAVNDLSLEVKDKEFVVLLGPSGCGKTTTLNMVAGLDMPTSGHILMDGRYAERVPPERRDVAMVFQSIALYPGMSVFDNIAFPLKMAKTPRPDIDRRVRDVAALLRIDHLLDRKPYQLSGGQRQRVALGRAVVRQPAVFLFDEPLSSLDAKLRVDMRVELKKLHERLDATFIYVTHDQVEALTMADRIAVMDQGVLLQHGHPREIYDRPVSRMVASFLGSPGMNFVSGRCAQRESRASFESGDFSIVLPNDFSTAVGVAAGQDLILGIRPEGVRVGSESGPGRALVSGNVFATEPVGSDLFVDVSFDGRSTDELRLFKVRARPDLVVRVGESIPLILPHENLYFFDGGGRRIYPPAGAS